MRMNRTGFRRKRRKADANLGSAHRFGKGFLRQVRIVADEFAGAIHNHLWRVNRLQAEAVAIGTLPIGKGAGRIWVPPSKAVPIVHVLTENYKFRSRDWLIAIQLLKEGICWWATGAPFRGKQFD